MIAGGFDYGHMTLGGWWWMALLWVVLIATIVYLVVRGQNVDRGRDTHALTARPSPQELLAERYARGEIDEDEFLRRRDVLDGSNSDTA